MEKALIDIRDYEHLVGMPYKRKCYDGSGFDCWSLVYHIYQMNNIEVPKVILDGWSIRGHHREIEKQRVAWKEVRYEDRGFLDVLLFHTSYRLNTHVGVVLNSCYFIHAHQDTGVVIEQFSYGLSSALINKVYRCQ